MTTILIVDDDPDIRDFLATVLGNEGYLVVEADGGAVALGKLRNIMPDLVISDLEMPGMSGVELCENIRKQSSVPVLFLSSHNESNDRIRALEGGADDYLSKPFHPRELIMRVQAILRRSQPGGLGRMLYETYCAQCATSMPDDADACPACDSIRPVSGWPEAATSQFEYLGRLVDERYVLDKFLGAGAMGWVYRAKSRKLHRDFACKIVDSNRFADRDVAEDMLRRFELEVETMSRLRNPHVVSVYESMELTKGVFGLMMEYVDGRTLHDLIDQVGRISVHRSLDLVRQIANGLHEAHEAGITHRDLKPANIMIEQLPASGFFVRILDFGIARVVGGAAATQGFLGTPLFASPEQCLGKEVDHRSDIYSLGAVLFMCLTGGPPFTAATSWKVMEQQVYGSAPKVSDVVKSARVTPALDQLVADLLAKLPDERPSDLNEVIQAIDSILRDIGPAGTSEPDDAPPAPLQVDDATPTAGATSAPQNSQDVGTRLSTHRLNTHGIDNATAISAAALAGTADFCAVSLPDGTLLALRLSDPQSGFTLHGVSGRICGLCVDGVRKRVVAADDSGGIWSWTTNKPNAPQSWGTVPERITHVDLDADGITAVCGTASGRVLLMSLTNEPKVLVTGGDPIGTVAIGAGQIIFSRGVAISTIPATGGTTNHLQPLAAPARSIAVSADGYLAAVLDAERTVRILNMLNGQTFFMINAKRTDLRALAFGDDGQLLGIGVADDSLTLWRLGPRMG